jgi:DNA-binding NtrC family response regulator
MSSKPGSPRQPDAEVSRPLAGEAEGDVCMQNNFEKLRVLVADDDYIIASTLSQILRLSGYDAETVSSGEEAIAAAAKSKPDVFISDVVMGGITGIDAAIRVLEFVPACLVILISGQARVMNEMSGERRTNHEFEILPKPVHPKVLLEQIAAFAINRTSKPDPCLQTDAPC